MNPLTLRLATILPRWGLRRPLAEADPDAVAAARDTARRWTDAQRRDPALAQDIIRLGGVLSPTGAPLDAARLAYEAGRRDLAQELLALMTLSPDEINDLASRE